MNKLIKIYKIPWYRKENEETGKETKNYKYDEEIINK